MIQRPWKNPIILQPNDTTQYCIDSLFKIFEASNYRIVLSDPDLYSSLTCNQDELANAISLLVSHQFAIKHASGVLELTETGIETCQNRVNYLHSQKSDS